MRQEAATTISVRVGGEHAPFDLVAYKDLSGNFGLIDRQCPHRRADLSYGYVEQCGLRCNYHGWLFDQHGTCTEQPYEDTAHPEIGLKNKVRIKAYPVKECAGLLFAYMGPAPVPELPVWAPFTWQGGFREIVRSDIPCNWFQCQENSIDPVHFEWMHDNWSQRLAGSHDYATKHLQVAFDEAEYGFMYRRIREGQEAELACKKLFGFSTMWLFIVFALILAERALGLPAFAPVFGFLTSTSAGRSSFPRNRRAESRSTNDVLPAPQRSRVRRSPSTASRSWVT